MNLPNAMEIQMALAELSKYGTIRRVQLGSLQAEFFEAKSESESGQAATAAPAIATPAQSGNSDEPVKFDILDVLSSGSPIPGAPDRGNLSGA